MNIKEMKNRKNRPMVRIMDVAYQKMMCYTNSVKTEIGWLGTATRDGKDFLIHDSFLLTQEVHGTTAELTTEGISSLIYEELSVRDDFEFILDNMKVWGHSHNVMGVTPSGQDEKQMEIFEDGGYDFIIRLITNHKGEIGVTIYDYENGLIYENMSWDIKFSEEIGTQIESAYRQLAYYQALVDTLENTSLIDEETIQEEIKTKVSTIKYVQPNIYNAQNGYGGVQKSYGTNQNVKKNETEIEKEIEDEYEWLKYLDNDDAYLYNGYR